MSLESVATAAATSVPSVRRRYANKVQLVAAVIDSLRDAPLPPAAGSPRADARAILRDFNRTLLRDNALTIVGSLLAEEHRHPELLQRFKARLVESRRGLLRQALAAGGSAGQLPLANLDVPKRVPCGVVAPMRSQLALALTASQGGARHPGPGGGLAVAGPAQLEAVRAASNGARSKTNRL